MSKQTNTNDALRVEKLDSGIAIIWFDCPGQKVNTLSPPLLDEFESKVAPLLSDPQVKGLVLASAKEGSFIAGADIKVLDGMNEAEAAALSKEGNRVLSQLSASPKPVVAAVHGAALGGGLEVALACDFIVASNHPKTELALPEVMLGLLPGGGGTQRLARRIGLMAALPMLLTGKKLRAKRAKRAGLVDMLTTPAGIAYSAARAAEALASGKLKKSARKKNMMDKLVGFGPVRSFVLKKARQQVKGQTRGNYPAPFAILDCVETGLAKGMSAGLAKEAELFGKVVASEASNSLIFLFQQMTASKKGDGEATPRPVGRMAVLGAGLMGSGIASVSLGKSLVVAYDPFESSLSKAGKAILTGLGKMRRSGSLTRSEHDRRWSNLLLTPELADIAGADLVIEAIPEELELKRKVLAEVEELIDADAVIASNTSALPIGDIAEGSKHPERILGMHYFSPVPKMKLLEIIVTEKTSEQALATAIDYGAAQGKAIIVVRDGPGFYTTRILSPYLNEAALLLEEGARIEDLDRHLKDFGFPVGPIALIDEVGIDVGAHVSEDLGELFRAKGFKTTGVMTRLDEAGYKGRKNKKGFYDYSAKKKKPNEAIYQFFGGMPRKDVDAKKATRRMAFVFLNEAVRCLEEGIIASPGDGDMGAILGLGFPPFRGGPFHWVDREGASSIVDEMNALADELGPRFKPTDMLVDLAAKGGKFFD